MGGVFQSFSWFLNMSLGSHCFQVSRILRLSFIGGFTRRIQSNETEPKLSLYPSLYASDRIQNGSFTLGFPFFALSRQHLTFVRVFEIEANT